MIATKGNESKALLEKREAALLITISDAFGQF